MYLAVFLLRYMDIFWNFVSVYNSFMKIFFISSTCIIIYAMRYKKPYCLVSFFIYWCHNSIFIDLRLTWWWLSTFQGACSSRYGSYSHLQYNLPNQGPLTFHKFQMVVRALVESQSLAWGSRIHPINRHAQQN